MASPSSAAVIQGNEGEDKDSLFSSEGSEDKAVKILSPEITETTKQFEYTENELQTLVSYIKNITTLYDLQDSDWTEKCEKTIGYWFLEKSEPLLTIYFIEDELICDTDVPHVAVCDMMYFIKTSNKRFEVETFYDEIFFGNLDDNIENSMLTIIRDVYAPMLYTSVNWPDSVKNDFYNSLHTFLGRITDIYYKLYGLTILYIPYIILNIPLEVGSTNKELVKRLEGIIVYWSKQIRIALRDRDQGSPEDMLCIKEEYEFWKYRHENLSGIKYQLSNKSLRHICKILASVHSMYVRQFRTLSDETTFNLMEAKSNIEYLHVLEKPCIELEQLKDPQEFPSKLTKILHLIGYIWLMSPFYNTTEKITVLCRSLSNQLIRQCSNYIDLDVVFVTRKQEKLSRCLKLASTV